MCRTCGGGAPLDAHFCPQCTKILTLARRGDYFSFLGLPRKLTLDTADLEQRFRALSRQFHPDYFYNATSSERLASLERSSYLNDAYRTLRQPIARIEYLLELESMGVGSSARTGIASESTTKEVPPALLEEVFALNEELDEVRDMRSAGAPEEKWRARLQTARGPIEAKREEHERRLASLANDWDALDVGPDGAEKRRVLTALREQMLERNYINNLLAGIERELSQ